MVLHFGARNILREDINQAQQEEKQQGKPTRKTLLTLAWKLIQCAPNYYSGQSHPSYSIQEKEAAKTLLTKNGMKAYCNLSTRCKAALLQQITMELAKEA